MTPAERLLDRLEGTKATGNRRWQALCPAHDDRAPSLSITEKATEDALLHCHAGCSVDEVLEALGLAKSDLFAERRNGGREVVAQYDYRDEADELLFQVVRFAPKDFRQRRPDGAGGWTWSLNGTRRVLYRLPRVLEAASRGEGVFIVEGEKDVEALDKVGVPATCNPGGAGKWRTEYAEALRGADAVVVADRDETGRSHAREVAASLEGIAASVDVVEPAEGKDIADHLAAGLGLGALVEFDCTAPKGLKAVQSNGLLPFTRLSTALAAVPEEPDWALHGYIARRALTLLAGRPKAGKSTLTFGVFGPLLAGRPFLGRSTNSTGILLLSEEREDTLKEKQLRFGLEGSVHLLMRHQVREQEWSQVVSEAAAYCKAHDLGVLVVDTFDKWVGLKGEEENSAGAVLAALEPLARAAGEGLAVLIIAHQRKAAGRHGEAVRGNNALTGGVDIVLELERAPADVGSASTRVLRAVSRFGATPDELVLELDGNEYRVHGDLDDLRGDAEESHLRAALAGNPGATVDVLAEEAGLNKATVRRRLQAWLAEGTARKEGSGRRGDPQRWTDCTACSPIDGAISSEEAA